MIWKRWAKVALAVLILLGMGGCKTGAEVHAETRDKALEGMREHLASRYGEIDYVANPVVMRELTNPSKDISYMYILMGENGQYQQEFQVERYGTAEEGFRYEDNYYWYVIRDEYEAQIKEELSGLFPECKVYLGVSWNTATLPEEINGQTSLEEAKEIGLPKHVFWIIVDPSQYTQEGFEQLESRLKDRWSEARPTPVIAVFLPSSQEIYDNTNRFNYHERMRGDGHISRIAN